MTTSVATATFQARIAARGATSIGTPDLTLAISDIAGIPVISGPSLDVLQARTTSHPFRLECIVDTVLFAAAGRLTEIGRLIEIRRDDGAGFTSIAIGRISHASEADTRGRITLEISDERWAERATEIFQTTDTVQLHPPGLASAWLNRPAAGERTYTVAQVSGDAVRIQPDNEAEVDGVLHIPLALRQALVTDMASGQVVNASNSAGNFTSLRFRFDGADRTVIAFSQALNRSPDTPEPVGILDTLSPRASGLLLNAWVYIAGHSLSPTDQITGRFYWPGGVAVSEHVPLHIGGTAGVHPFELLEDVLDGDYGGQPVRYDATAMQAMQDAPYKPVWARIFKPTDRAKWTEESIYRAFGVMPCVGTDLNLRPVSRRLPLDLNPATLTTLDATNAELPTWEHTSRELATVLDYGSQTARPLSATGIKPDDWPVDDYETVPALIPDFEHDNVATLGRVVHSVNTDLILSASGLTAGQGAIAKELSVELFHVFGDGAQRGEVTVSDDLGLDVGDYVVLDQDSFQGFNAGTGARTGDRIVLLVSFRDYGPASITFGYLDLGPLSTPLDAPTVSIAQDGTDLDLVNVTISGLNAGETATVEVAVGASEPAFYDLTQAGVGNETVSFRVNAGSGTAFARAYATAPNRIRSAYATDSVALTARARLTAADVYITADTATVTWVAPSSTLGVRTRYSVHARGADPTFGNQADFDADDGGFTISGLGPRDAITVELTPYPGWTGSAVSGAAGDTRVVMALMPNVTGGIVLSRDAMIRSAYLDTVRYPDEADTGGGWTFAIEGVYVDFHYVLAPSVKEIVVFYERDQGAGLVDNTYTHEISGSGRIRLTPIVGDSYTDVSFTITPRTQVGGGTEGEPITFQFGGIKDRSTGLILKQGANEFGGSHLKVGSGITLTLDADGFPEISAAGGEGVVALEDVGDVGPYSGLVAGDALAWTGSEWVNRRRRAFDVTYPPYNITGDGVTLVTAGFAALVAEVGAGGGGRIVCPPGTYLISELDIDYENVVIEGMTSGLGYEEPSAAVTLLCESGVYAVHLKYTDASRRADLGGLRNLVVKSTSDVEYGVVVSTGVTVMDAVTVQGFQYGCSQVAGGNQNIYDRCAFISNSKAGFAYTEIENGAAAYLHPNLTIVNTLTSTKITLRDCNIRRNEIGIIARTGERLRLEGCVIESNEQYGAIIYKADTSLATRCSYMVFDNCWWENNYNDYTIGDTGYSITGINALKVDATTYINGDQTGAWTSLGDAGYQVWIGSETEDFVNEPPKHIRFVNNTLIGSSDQQHDARIRSARFVLFDTCEFRTGGNARPAGISLEAYARSVHFFNCEAEQQVALGEGTLTAVFRNQDGTTTFEDGGVAYEYGSVIAPRLIATDRSEPGAAAISRTMPGVVLGARGMNATSAKYTPALQFMSSDPNLTTENPKLLAYIAGVAQETYAADDDGAMGIEIGTTTSNPGVTSVPTPRVLVSGSGSVVILGQELQINNALNHDGATAGFYGVAPVTQASVLTVEDDAVANSGDATTDAVIDNIRTRIGDIETVLERLGLIAPQSLNLWISKAEIDTRPMSGADWTDMLATADATWPTAAMSDQDSTTNLYALSGALVYLRTGTVSYRTKVEGYLQDLIDAGYEKVSPTALGYARNLGAFVLAADMCNIRLNNPTLHADFAAFAEGALTESYVGGGMSDVRDGAYGRPNNIGNWCRWSCLITYAYIGDTAELDGIVEEVAFWMGDRTRGGAEALWGPTAGPDLSWHEDPTDSGTLRGIVSDGVTRFGHDFSGIQPEEMRRDDSFWSGAFPSGATVSGANLGATAPTTSIVGELLFFTDDSNVSRAVATHNVGTGDVTWSPDLSSAPAEDDQWSVYPGETGLRYVEEALDAALGTVEIIRRLGYGDAHTWSDSAVLRAVTRLKYFADNHSANNWTYFTEAHEASRPLANWFGLGYPEARVRTQLNGGTKLYGFTHYTHSGRSVP